MAYLVVEKNALIDLATIAVNSIGSDQQVELDGILAELGLEADTLGDIQTVAGAVKSGG